MSCNWSYLTQHSIQFYILIWQSICLNDNVLLIKKNTHIQIDRQSKKNFVTNNIFGLFITQKQSSKLFDKSYGTHPCKETVTLFCYMWQKLWPDVAADSGFLEITLTENKISKFCFCSIPFHDYLRKLLRKRARLLYNVFIERLLCKSSLGFSSTFIKQLHD